MMLWKCITKRIKKTKTDKIGTTNMKKSDVIPMKKYVEKFRSDYVLMIYLFLDRDKAETCKLLEISLPSLYRLLPKKHRSYNNL